jgi:lysozyme
MKYSEQAVRMIKNFEGLRLTSYKCVPTEKKWTIGYGHYGVGENVTITESRANLYLMKDMIKAEKAVDKYDKDYSFNQNQYDALVSFAFNVGSIDKLTAKGTRTKDAIGEAITLYNKSGGKVIPGLVKRRKAEQMLYNTPIKGEVKSASQLAKEVIAGKWGNGEARRIKLESYGYNYKEVQRYVNIMLTS